MTSAAGQHVPAVGHYAGPGYVAALLADDAELIANYRRAFTDGELLEAMTAPLTLLVRYLGYHTDRTPTEIGDALMRATRTTKEASL